MDLFITCARTLEPLLADELSQLGYADVKQAFRGVYVYGVDAEAIYRINYCSRLAGRVLLPLERFECRDSKSLYQSIGKVDWQVYIPKGKTFAIDANVTHPRLRNSLFAAQVAKDAICDQLKQVRGERPNIDVRHPDVQLNLYINQNAGSISFDTSGVPLHKRGYRQEGVEAPIQETLAAALLVLARYRGDEIFYDPCCGSGTLLIEAGLMASHTPPGFLRRTWGFMLLPDYSADAWLKVKTEADAKRIELPKRHFFGTDINKQAIHASRVNMRAAGLGQVVEIIHHDFRDFKPSIPPTFVMTNPPHGMRLGEIEQLRGLYRQLGDFMKRETAKPARGFIFTSSRELAKEVGLAAARRHVVENSGIDSRLLEFDLY